MPTPRPILGLPNLAWLRAFEAAARTSSFAAAAGELHLTSGAISYQIRALEAHLGFALFQRLPRGVKLTPMGVAYLPPVRKAFEELADATVGLFGGSEQIQVTLHAPVSLTALWLAPHLPLFQVARPDIDLRLSSVIWDDPVPGESTDLEIRYGAGHWHGYRAEHLLNQRIAAVCSPRTPPLERLQRPIHIRGYENHWAAFGESLGPGALAAGSAMTVDTTLAALEIASSGGGFALTHGIFFKPYLACGRLIAAGERTFEDENSYFVVAPQRPQRPRREVQVCRDWLMSLAAPEATRDQFGTPAAGGTGR